MANLAAPAGVSRPVALRAPSRETPAGNPPPLHYAPLVKQRFQEEATSILTQGDANSIRTNSYAHYVAQKIETLAVKAATTMMKLKNMLKQSQINQRQNILLWK